MVKSQIPVHVKGIRQCSYPDTINKYSHEKEGHSISTFTSEKLEKHSDSGYWDTKSECKNGFCRKELKHCLKNFICFYTDHLMMMLDGLSNTAEAVDGKYSYHNQLGNAIISDIQNALLQFNVTTGKNGYDRHSNKCILCAVVDKQKSVEGLVNGNSADHKDILTEKLLVNGYSAEDMNTSNVLDAHVARDFEFKAVHTSLESIDLQMESKDTDRDSGLSNVTTKSISTDKICTERFALIEDVSPLIWDNFDPLLVPIQNCLAIDMNGLASEIAIQGSMI